MTLSATVHAVVASQGGLDQLEYPEGWPTPRPASGVVRVRVGACGLNNSNCNTRGTRYFSSVTTGITDTSGKQGFESTDPASA
jgi:NADPH:quinone reductase-like Zn-dependent oxidoreductase